MPKTEFLQIRCTPEQRERLAAVARAEHLDLSTWARRELLLAAERHEIRSGKRPRLSDPHSMTTRAVADSASRDLLRRRR